VRPRGDRLAFGAPGIDPRWQHGDKVGVGTAYAGDSRLWYTLWRGIVTEVYYPIVDHPQLRDLQLLLTDGKSYFHEERRHLTPEVSLLDPIAPAYRVVSTPPEGGYHLEKEVFSNPHLPALVERHRLFTAPGVAAPTAYVLAAPHLGVGGAHNTAYVLETAGRQLLVAERNDVVLALGASRPFVRLSVGFVGASDGWTDLSQHRALTWEFDRAPDGNVALVGELPMFPPEGVTVALGFGRNVAAAVTAVLQTLGARYDELKARFLEQWSRSARHLPEFLGRAADGGALARASHTTILVHEDKTYPGAFPASLSIPWGNVRNDADRGGYHLVWTRDLCQAATGLLAVGARESPLRTLIYLAASQGDDGGFPQNFWLSGQPYWAGVQLDEVSFPVLLAGHLRRAGALAEFDPYPMVRGAARYLLTAGPATGQERWEECAGYSPSTLAAHIAALLTAGSFARERGEPDSARYLEEHADFLEGHLERWTVTHRGELVPGRPRHFVRILPRDPFDPNAPEDLESAELVLRNRPEGEPDRFPARNVVDAGFLELVRYGVRRADDPVVRDSIAVVDAVLKVETPSGPCWHRYNHDGYGQAADGGPFTGTGVGRAWPLLTGERGHYEIAAGRSAAPYLRTLERLASSTGLLTEQVWDKPDRPEEHLYLGRPTGAAMPLLWAHAEYLKLLRSAVDGKVFDRVPEAVARYASSASRRPGREVWSARRRPATVAPGESLRLQFDGACRVRWWYDGSAPVEVDATPVEIGICFLDLPEPAARPARLRFTLTGPGAPAPAGTEYGVDFLSSNGPASTPA
jgi:glucoamylase